MLAAITTIGPTTVVGGTHSKPLHVSLEDPLQVQLLDLSLQSGGEAGVHGGATRQNNVLVELGPCVHVCCLDGIEEELSDSHSIHVDQVRLEECLRSPKALSSNLHSTTIGKLCAIGRGIGGTSSSRG